MIDSIELQKFTLGTRTPFLTYLKLHEMTEDLKHKKVATDLTSRNPPEDMASREKYQVRVCIFSLFYFYCFTCIEKPWND